MASLYNFADKSWSWYLPPKYKEILAKAGNPTNLRSYKEIYYKIYRGIYIEGGTQRVTLDWYTDKVILMVSAKALDINGGLDSRYWQWVATDDSRFEQAAEAKYVEWFEVWQKIQSTILSPNTNYSVSFVLKIDKTQLAGTSSTPFEFSLKPTGGESKVWYIYLDDLQKPVVGVPTKMNYKNSERGWTEFFLGEFTTKEEEVIEIEVCMKNTDRKFLKKGITIDGVKITPMN